MASTCCVPGCPSKKTYKNPSISFHGIPVKANLRSLWLRLLAKQAPLVTLNDYSAVCSLHFTLDDFKKDTRKRRLLPSAAPSIFPRYPSLLEPPLEPLQKQNLIPKQEKKKSPKYKSPAPIPIDEDTSARTRSIGVQVSQLRTGHLEQLKKENGRLRSQHHRIKENIKNLKDNMITSQQKFNNLPEYEKIKKIKECANSKPDNVKAKFLMDQVNNFEKQQPHWSETSLFECLAWRDYACSSYEYARGQHLISLPSRCTLERFYRNKEPPLDVDAQNTVDRKKPEPTLHTIIIKESPSLDSKNDSNSLHISAIIIKNVAVSKKHLQIPSFDTLMDETLHAIIIPDIAQEQQPQSPGCSPAPENNLLLSPTQQSVSLMEANFDVVSSVDVPVEASIHSYGTLVTNENSLDTIIAGSDSINDIVHIEIS